MIQQNSGRNLVPAAVLLYTQGMMRGIRSGKTSTLKGGLIF